MMGAPVDEIRNATRDAFRGMIDLAIEENVDFVVIAGDLYDGDWSSWDTGMAFYAEITRLSEIASRPSSCTVTTMPQAR